MKLNIPVHAFYEDQRDGLLISPLDGVLRWRIKDGETHRDLWTTSLELPRQQATLLPTSCTTTFLNSLK